MSSSYSNMCHREREKGGGREEEGREEGGRAGKEGGRMGGEGREEGRGVIPCS